MWRDFPVGWNKILKKKKKICKTDLLFLLHMPGVETDWMERKKEGEKSAKLFLKVLSQLTGILFSAHKPSRDMQTLPAHLPQKSAVVATSVTTFQLFP